MTKIAAYNVENLFQRPRAFNEESNVSKKTIEAVAELNSLFEEDIYSNSAKSRMVELLKVLELTAKKLNHVIEGKYGVSYLKSASGKISSLTRKTLNL